MAARDQIYDEFAELMLSIEQAITDIVAEQMRIFGSEGKI
ncbi:fructose-bisphosphate aldolase [Pseudescherichia vulneris]|nr:fructose-bisphosphate aldolase [Pseudescherichia vulneris]